MIRTIIVDDDIDAEWSKRNIDGVDVIEPYGLNNGKEVVDGFSDHI